MISINRGSGVDRDVSKPTLAGFSVNEMYRQSSIFRPITENFRKINGYEYEDEQCKYSSKIILRMILVMMKYDLIEFIT